MTSAQPVYVWSGQITFTGAIDPTSTNVATLTLMPGQGETTLPAVINGTPGLPPVLRTVTVHQVPVGTTPQPATWTVVDPGGSGEASTYDLDIYVNAGAKGDPGTNATISAASDVEGMGSIAEGYVLHWNATDSKWQVGAPRKVTGPYASLPANFNPAYGGSLGQYIVTSIGIPALPYAWRPVVDGALYCGGTINTKVDLIARLNDPANGQQVGYGLGQFGVGPYPVILGTAPGNSIAGSSTYGLVAANTAATIYLVALQTNSTNDSWYTQNTNGRFSVVAVPA